MSKLDRPSIVCVTDHERSATRSCDPYEPCYPMKGCSPNPCSPNTCCPNFGVGLTREHDGFKLNTEALRRLVSDASERGSTG